MRWQNRWQKQTHCNALNESQCIFRIDVTDNGPIQTALTVNKNACTFRYKQEKNTIVVLSLFLQAHVIRPDHIDKVQISLLTTHLSSVLETCFNLHKTLTVGSHSIYKAEVDNMWAFTAKHMMFKRKRKKNN